MAWMSGFFVAAPSLRAVTVVSAACLVSACMTAKLEESRTLETGIATGEAVVLLAQPHVEPKTTRRVRMKRGSGLASAAGMPPL